MGGSLSNAQPFKRQGVLTQIERYGRTFDVLTLPKGTVFYRGQIAVVSYAGPGGEGVQYERPSQKNFVLGPQPMWFTDLHNAKAYAKRYTGQTGTPSAVVTCVLTQDCAFLWMNYRTANSLHAAFEAEGVTRSASYAMLNSFATNKGALQRFSEYEMDASLARTLCTLFQGIIKGFVSPRIQDIIQPERHPFHQEVMVCHPIETLRLLRIDSL